MPSFPLVELELRWKKDAEFPPTCCSQKSLAGVWWKHQSIWRGIDRFQENVVAMLVCHLFIARTKLSSLLSFLTCLSLTLVCNRTHVQSTTFPNKKMNPIQKCGQRTTPSQKNTICHVSSRWNSTPLRRAEIPFLRWENLKNVYVPIVRLLKPYENTVLYPLYRQVHCSYRIKSSW